MATLSSLAQLLLHELTTISAYAHDPAHGAFVLSHDRAVSTTRRAAYADIYNYLTQRQTNG